MNLNPTIIAKPETFGAIPYSSVASLDWAENQNQTAQTQKVLELQVPLDMPRRKIYAWLYVKPTGAGADYYCDCRLSFYKGTSAMGFLPLRIGASNGNANTVVPSSLVSAFTTNGTTAADSLGVFLGNQQTGEPNSITLQPLYISGQFDRIVLECRGLQNVTYYRTFAACISST